MADFFVTFNIYLLDTLLQNFRGIPCVAALSASWPQSIIIIIFAPDILKIQPPLNDRKIFYSKSN